MLSLFELFEIISDKNLFYIWLFDIGLLNFPPKCECGGIFLLSSRSGVVDNVMWRCTTCHSYGCSLRNNSFCSNSKLTLQQIILIIYYWTTDVCITSAFVHLDISQQSLVDWYNFCREVCSKKLLSIDCRLGGPGYTISIDESVITKRKYNRGRHIAEKWIFGMYCTQTKIGLLWFVPNRKRVTLLPYIQRMVKPWSTIQSDCYKSYFRISKLGFKHQTVNHSVTFIDPISGACTNGVEGFWSRCKARLKKVNGSSVALKPAHLEEFMWRQRYIWQENSDGFMSILEHIAEFN